MYKSLLAISILFISCGSSKKMTNTTHQNISGAWQLAILENEVISLDEPIFLDFGQENKVTGFLGCNRVFGNYEIGKNNKIQFQQLAATKMFCPNMDLENRVLDRLNGVTRFVVNGDTLSFLTANNVAVAKLTKRAAILKPEANDEIVNKYWKLKTLRGKAVVMAANQTREQYFTLKEDNTITGFGGCNQFNGRYEIPASNEIKVDNSLAMTMMACPDVKVDESAFVKIFEEAGSFVCKEDRLSLISNSGEEIATFEAVYF